jgi:hypothetical protein
MEKINCNQQPFYLRNTDRLLISDDFAKFITKDVTVHDMTRNIIFFNNTRHTRTYQWNNKPSTYTRYDERMATTGFSVRWNRGGSGFNYAMTIYIYRVNEQTNDSGKFQYYIGGRSGDSEMFGKNMIRATRQCNINLIKKYFPIFNHIKYAHKKLQTDTFYDVIKKSIQENPKLDKYLSNSDVPKEIKVKLNHILRKEKLLKIGIDDKYR